MNRDAAEHDASNLLIAALGAISDELTRLHTNLMSDETYSSPFWNGGERFDCETFSAHAYSWDESVEQPWNFRWRDLRVSWYKRLGRSTTTNRPVAPDEIATLLDECLTALAGWERARDSIEPDVGPQTASPDEEEDSSLPQSLPDLWTAYREAEPLSWAANARLNDLRLAILHAAGWDLALGLYPCQDRTMWFKTEGRATTVVDEQMAFDIEYNKPTKLVGAGGGNGSPE